jgi:hypothetical protein
MRVSSPVSPQKYHVGGGGNEINFLLSVLLLCFRLLLSLRCLLPCERAKEQSIDMDLNGNANDYSLCYRSSANYSQKKNKNKNEFINFLPNIHISTHQVKFWRSWEHENGDKWPLYPRCINDSVILNGEPTTIEKWLILFQLRNDQSIMRARAVL